MMVPPYRFLLFFIVDENNKLLSMIFLICYWLFNNVVCNICCY